MVGEYLANGFVDFHVKRLSDETQFSFRQLFKAGRIGLVPAINSHIGLEVDLRDPASLSCVPILDRSRGVLTDSLPVL